jgi:hypothetical protein
LVSEIRLFGEFWEKRSDLDRLPTKSEWKSALERFKETHWICSGIAPICIGARRDFRRAKIFELEWNEE